MDANGGFMSIEIVNMKINGAEASLGNVSEKQLLDVIKVLSRNESSQKVSQPEKKERLKRSRVGAPVGNYQYESTPTPIDDRFDIELAISSRVLAKSFDSGKILPAESKQLQARREVVWVFVDNGNKALGVDDICKGFCESLSLTPRAASNYISQCARLGVLAKDKSGKNVTYFLSSWFINQTTKNK